MTLTLIDYIDEDGDELSCPMFVCDQCGQPIQALGGWLRGIVLWQPREVDGAWVTGPIHYVHQGDCDHRFSSSRGGINHFWSRELSEYLHQLVHNTTTPGVPQ